MLFGLDRYHSFIFFLPLRPSLLSSPVACLCLSVCICLVCLLCLSRSLGIRPRSCRSDNALLILCWCALVLFLSHFIFPFGLTFMSFSFLFVLLVFARLFFFFRKILLLGTKKMGSFIFLPLPILLCLRKNKLQNRLNKTLRAISDRGERECTAYETKQIKNRQTSSVATATNPASAAAELPPVPPLL